MDLIESLNTILRHFFSEIALTSFKCGSILGLFLCLQLQISPAPVSYEKRRKKNVVSHFTSWFDSRPFPSKWAVLG